MDTISSPAASSYIAQAASPPRRDWLRLLAVLLAIIGLGISGYITIVKLTGGETVCANNGVINCDLVQSSIYSKLFGIPIQYLGVIGYLGILGVLALEPAIPFFAKRSKLLIFAMTLFGFLYSAYLTAMEAFVLHAWCLWCVGSAITMTILFGVSFARLWQAISAPIEDELLASGD